MSIKMLSAEGVYAGPVILVNGNYGFAGRSGDTLSPALGRGEIWMERRAEKLLKCLLERIDAKGRIVPVSGWRSREEQQRIWTETIRKEGLDFAQKYVALPGHSEHETGLAIDLALNEGPIDFIRPAFPYEGICQEFRRLAAQYGFVERYPAQKEHITGIAHEPWHFRYVGPPHAQVMEKKGLCLEEYVEFLKNFPNGERALCVESGERQVCISYKLAQREGETQVEVDEDMPYEVSGNNVDGFIVTCWRKRDGNKPGRP